MHNDKARTLNLFPTSNTSFFFFKLDASGWNITFTVFCNRQPNQNGLMASKCRTVNYSDSWSSDSMRACKDVRLWYWKISNGNHHHGKLITFISSCRCYLIMIISSLCMPSIYVTEPNNFWPRSDIMKTASPYGPQAHAYVYRKYLDWGTFTDISTIYPTLSRTFKTWSTMYTEFACLVNCQCHETVIDNVHLQSSKITLLKSERT